MKKRVFWFPFCEATNSAERRKKCELESTFNELIKSSQSVWINVVGYKTKQTCVLKSNK